MDSLFKRLFGQIKSRTLLASAFALLLLTTLLFTSWLLLSTGERVVQSVLSEVASSTHRETRDEINRFLDTPDIINDYVSRSILSARVSGTNREAMHRLYWDAPRGIARTAVSGIYFGTEDGNHTGLIAETRNWPPLEWRYSESSPSTKSWLEFYQVGDGGQIGRRVSRIEGFDPRSRPWYIKAIEHSPEPIWTDIYADFRDGSPTLTRAKVVLGTDGKVLGVAGVDLFIKHLQQFLSQLSLSESSEVFIADTNGKLIGVDGLGDVSRILTSDVQAVDSGLRFTSAAARYMVEHRGGFKELDSTYREYLSLDGEDGYFMVSPVGREQGLEWSLGVFVPEKDYLASLGARFSRVIPLGLFGLGLSLFTLLGFLSLVVRPLRQLRNGASRIAVGEFDIPIDTSCGNEIGDLARAIDVMRNRIRDTFSEITEQKLRAEITLDSIADGVITINADGTLRYMNAIAENLTGKTLQRCRGDVIDKVFKARDAKTEVPITRKFLEATMLDAEEHSRELVLTGAGGVTHLIQCRVSAVRHKPVPGPGQTDGWNPAFNRAAPSPAGTVSTPAQELTGTAEADGNFGAVLIFSDLTEEQRLKSELLHQATHDGLTGLVNRREFERRIQRSIDSAQRRGARHALCYIDLDQFKVVNDTCGHASGDELLRQVARLLVDKLRSGDTVARLGGDEFGVLMENCDIERAREVAEQIRQSVSEMQFFWQDRTFSIGMTAGLVGIDQSAPGMASILRDADAACYIAKSAGRNRVHVHLDGDDLLAERRSELQWAERVRSALQEESFLLFAQSIEETQPMVSSRLRFEVLLRLEGEDGEPVLPQEFLPATERFGLSTDVDKWVLSKVVDSLISQGDSLEAIELVTINLSGQSLSDEGFLQFSTLLMDEHPEVARRLCFEVTETATIANLAHALKLIDALKRRGCRFALDDFGSGLSSFAYLKTLPVEYLKIDGMFIRDLLTEPLDLAMVRSINEVGQSMGMQTIAEFVESDELRDQLKRIGVDFVQGHIVDTPQPLNDWLDEHRVAPARVDQGRAG